VTGPLSTSPLLWYDPSNAASITASGGNVSQLNDLSGNGYHMTAAGAAQPVTGSYTINSLNTLLYTGASQMSTATIPSTSPPLTFFTVLRIDPAAFVGQIVWQSATGSNIYGPLMKNTGVWTMYGASFVDSAVSVTGNPHLIDCILNGASSSLDLDGLQIASGNPGNGLPAATSYQIGSGSFIGALGEMLVYASALTANDRTTVQQYLIQKWFVANSGGNVASVRPPALSAPSKIILSSPTNRLLVVPPPLPIIRQASGNLGPAEPPGRRTPSTIELSRLNKLVADSNQNVVLSNTASDTAGGTDVAVRSALTLARTGSDTAGGTDSTTRLVVLARTASDTAGATDSATRTEPKSRTGSDTAGGTDSATRLDVLARTASDTAGATDTATRALRLTRSTADTAGGTDNASGTVVPSNVHLTRTAADTAGGTDAATRTAPHARTGADTAGGTDTAVHIWIGLRTVSDTAGGTDAPSRFTGRFRIASDTAGGTDTAVGSARPGRRLEISVGFGTPRWEAIVSSKTRWRVKQTEAI
jgi:hypothetical protein